MTKYKLLDIDLTLFDGGAGGAGGGEGGGASASTGAESGATGDTTSSLGPTHRGKKTGEYDGVKFGKQDTETTGETATETTADATPSAAEKGTKESGVHTTSDALEAKRAAFQELINGEYKDLYTEDTQRIIDRRFRETKSLEQKVNQHSPIIETLMQRYHIADGDVDKLTAAIDNDDAYWHEAAEEAGMTVERYKQLQKFERENKALKEDETRRRNQQRAQKQMLAWQEGEKQTQKVYPEFSLKKEAKNPQFTAMLKAGVPVQHAYEVVHMDTIKKSVATSTAKQTEKAVVDGIRAKGARPAENGTSSNSAFTVKDDPSKWSKKDRAEIARRVQRGESIKL